jgi:hypothetical protein
MLAIALVVFSVLVVQAQVPAFGRCPEYDAMPAFDKEKFLGKWCVFVVFVQQGKL